MPGTECRGLSVRNHHINIFYSKEDRAWVADIPDLRSCSALGKTPEEALAEVERAKGAWLKAAKAAGKPIPKPRYRPMIYQASR
jgi:predicted RNase H-like HicB family nuclease